MMTPFDDFRERMLFECRGKHQSTKLFMTLYGEYRENAMFKSAPGNVQFLLLLGGSEEMLSTFGDVTANDVIFPQWFMDKIRKKVPWDEWNEQTMERFITLSLLTVRGLTVGNDCNEKLKYKLGSLSLFLLRVLTGYTNRGINMYKHTYEVDTQLPALITFGKRKTFVSPDLQIGMYHVLPLIEAGLQWIDDANVQAYAAKAFKRTGIGINEAIEKCYNHLFKKGGESCTLSPEIEETELAETMT